MTVRNEEMQALIDAQAQLAQECLDAWDEAESDYDTSETPDSIMIYFSQRDWPLETVFRNHELWVETGGRKGVRANFQGCDFSGLAGVADFDEPRNQVELLISRKISFNGRAGQCAIFAGANLTHMTFDRAWLQNADFRGADLDSASFFEADLTGALFSGAFVSDSTRFGCAKLQGADFRHANYECLNLSGANALGVLLANPDPDNEEETERRGVWFGHPVGPARRITKVSKSLFTHLIQFMPLEDIVGVTIV